MRSYLASAYKLFISKAKAPLADGQQHIRRASFTLIDMEEPVAISNGG
jgi:hypothetical protein